MQHRKTVTIIGLGINGLVTAFELANNGYDVTLVDKNSEVSLEASYQNGGQLSFGHIDSVASYQNILRGIIGSKAINISPLCFFNKSFLRFAISVFKNSKAKARQQNLKELSSLAKQSKEDFYNRFTKYFTQQELLSCDYRKDGILHFFTNLKYFHFKIKHYKSLNIEIEVLSKSELLNLDQSLYFKHDICGGILFKNDASINCYKLSLLLKQKLETIGAKFYFNKEVCLEKDFIINNNSLGARDEYLKSDYYIFTNGIKTDINFLTKDKSKVPYVMQGYSFDIDIRGSSHAPQMAMTDSQNRLVYSLQNQGKTLRVAGFADFTILKKTNQKQGEKRFNDMLKIVLKTFPALKRSEIKNKWVGHRPCTSSSLPFVGKTKFSNTFVNTGHTNLGLTLSFASAGTLLSLVKNC
jgi:D-amino-acid dehydrogenase